MSYIVFELCKGVRSELAIFPRKGKAREIVDLLKNHYRNDMVKVDYEITDLWGHLEYSSAHEVKSETKLIGMDNNAVEPKTNKEAFVRVSD